MLRVNLIGAFQFGGSVGEGIALVDIITSSLPDANLGQPYSATMACVGGFPPYTWSVSSGALPPGLTMDGGGNITGIPTTLGDFNFVITVLDGVGGAASIQGGMAL